MMSICRTCITPKPIEEFVKQNTVKSGRDTECKNCKSERNRKYYAKNPTTKINYNKSDTRKNYMYKRLYGITLDEYNQMFQEQNGLCAICNQNDGKRLHVDHDHVSGKVRGLLCLNCNRGLGAFNDDPELVQKSVAYLLKDS